jgi:hypothetical protein
MMTTEKQNTLSPLVVPVCTYPASIRYQVEQLAKGDIKHQDVAFFKLFRLYGVSYPQRPLQYIRGRLLCFATTFSLTIRFGV